jgi:hypothetical protein
MSSPLPLLLLFLLSLSSFLSLASCFSSSAPFVLPFFCSTCSVSCERPKPPPEPPPPSFVERVTFFTFARNPKPPPILRHSLGSISTHSSSNSPFHPLSYNRCLCQILARLVKNDTLSTKDFLISELRNASLPTQQDEIDLLGDDLCFDSQGEFEEYEEGLPY